MAPRSLWFLKRPPFGLLPLPAFEQVLLVSHLSPCFLNDRLADPLARLLDQGLVSFWNP